MDDIDNVGSILSNSSAKIIFLVSLLKKHLDQNGENIKALIFVQRRHTAKNIFHIIQKCSEIDPEFKIRPDFMVGNNSSLPDSIETILQNKWNREVLKRFKKNKINVIVATSVLEEGIDLQMCNLVISYDVPQEFRSYVQSKGRARMKGSNYIIMCPSENYGRLQGKLIEWNDVESILKDVSLFH